MLPYNNSEYYVHIFIHHTHFGKNLSKTCTVRLKANYTLNLNINTGHCMHFVYL